MGKIFAIGDVHGCLRQLKDLLAQLTINPEEDRLVFIGDYVDRGRDIREAVDFILNLKEIYQVVCLIGNHERMFMDFHDFGLNRDLWLANGGIKTIDAYGLVKASGGRRIDVPKEHLTFYRSLLPYYETEDYIFVHAGLKPGIPLADQYLTDLVWIREEFIESDYDFGKRVIFGHTPYLSGPYIDPYKIGIDTGAVYGGKLTCLELPAMTFYEAP